MWKFSTVQLRKRLGTEWTGRVGEHSLLCVHALVGCILFFITFVHLKHLIMKVKETNKIYSLKLFASIQYIQRHKTV